MNTTTDYDLIIIGGGMVGASLAISLASQALRVALIEAAPLYKSTPPSYDDRAIALSFGSRRIFDGMGLWEKIAPQTTTIQRIHVSDQGCFGFTRLDATQEKVDALGYVVTAQQLGAVLMSQLQQCNNLTLMSPAKLTDLKLGDDHATVVITRDPDNNNGNTESLTSKLLVAADGGNSHVRNQLGIHTTAHDYGQTAIIANITPEKSHRHIAYERFTRNGPLALLPMPDNRCSLVWTRTPEDAQRLLRLNDADFLTELQPCFGKRLGYFIKVGKRHSYPLQLIQAQEQVRRRLALIGNAAHTLHPIAGQGFNLGLRDVAALAQNIVDTFHAGDDIGALSVLEVYAQWRERDHRQVIGFTNTLVHTFSNRFPPLVLARNLGLIATDTVPPLKHLLARHSMGIAGKLPRLARGLPL
ncbi:MAG: 2-octaprenyl-6-methoxyphenyl hydroxylase [Gammaproteobacteria bacterium]|nr:2-octaprenyl-6-methoxyphenyl hydroxylase [Gammaproteobacteria bacterium]MCF6260990.1 2-octaprenyl-6-methoxyphenyl hydroxylase [Gammaproteobacteria bacterium]